MARRRGEFGPPCPLARIDKGGVRHCGEQVDLQAKHADDLRASLEQLRTELKEIKVPLEPIER